MPGFPRLLVPPCALLLCVGSDVSAAGAEAACGEAPSIACTAAAKGGRFQEEVEEDVASMQTSLLQQRWQFARAPSAGAVPAEAPGAGRGLLDFLLRIITQVRSRLINQERKLPVPRDALALVDRWAPVQPRVPGQNGYLKPGDNWKFGGQSKKDILIEWLLGCGVYAFLVIIFAFLCYTKNQEVDIEAAKAQCAGKSFAHHPFSCMDDPRTCLISCCCPAIKWADNMRAISFHSFWVALLVFLFFQCTADLVLVTWVVGAAYLAYNRQRMRRVFGMKNGPHEIYTDYCMWFCCMCCATAQETRHVGVLTKKEKESA